MGFKMADLNEEEDEAIIVKADYTLLRKFAGASLDKIFSPEAISAAEKAITDAAGGLYAECVEEGKKLQTLVARLKEGPSAATLQDLIDTAFSAKTKAGLAGFDLVAALAKSLQILCEKTSLAELVPATIQIIEWHIQSISQLLTLKVKGNGGEAGKAILAEIEKLNR